MAGLMVYKDTKMGLFPKFRNPIAQIFKNKLININKKTAHKGRHRFYEFLPA